MNQPRPSCKTIAQEAGVSRMTVSMALRDHPRVAPETRKRIKKIAEAQGYTPDPNLTELMRYLRKRNISKEEPVIAILNGKNQPVDRLGKDSRLIREGARPLRLKKKAISPRFRSATAKSAPPPSIC